VISRRQTAAAAPFRDGGLAGPSAFISVRRSARHDQSVTLNFVWDAAETGHGDQRWRATGWMTTRYANTEP
jgi:hypothetical protein